MSPRPASLAALLVCAACNLQAPEAAKPAQATNEPITNHPITNQPVTPDPWTLQTIESLGDRAAYVVVLELEHWPELRRVLAALTRPNFGPSPLVAADTPAQLLTAILTAAEIPRKDAAPQGPVPPLLGMDPSRPVVLALAEAPGDAPGSDFATGLPILTGALPGLRHELVLPATDVEQLRGSLATLLDRLGVARPELVAGQPNAYGWKIGDASVALLVGTETIRVIAVTHTRPLEASAPITSTLLRAPAEPPSRTAGVVAAARRDVPLSVLVRSRAQARLTLWQIARDGLVDPLLPIPARFSQRMAIQRALRCDALLQGSGRGFEDWTLGLVVENTALRLRLVASLGDAGREIFSTETTPDGLVHEPLQEDLLARDWLRLEPHASLAAGRDSSSPMAALAELLPFTELCDERLPALLGYGPFANLQYLQTLVHNLMPGQSSGTYALAPLRNQLAELPGLAPMLSGEYLHLDLRRSGQALVGRWTLSNTPQDAPALDLSDVTWPQRQAMKPPPGAACGRRAALLAASRVNDPAALGAAASERIVRDAPGVGGTAALAELEAALACPEAMPAATVDNLRRLSTLALAGGLVDEWRTDEAASLLAGACTATGDELLCQHATGVRQLLAPHIPDVFVLCEDLAALTDAHRIGLDAGGLALDDHRIADLPALRTALEALVAAGDGKLDLDLGIDEKLPFATVRPLLAMLATIKGLKLTLALRVELSRNGAVVHLPIATPALGVTTPSDEPEPTAQFKAGALVFAVDGGAIRLRTGMINLGINAYPSPGALQAHTVGRVDNGEPPLVHATDDSPWSTVAIALAGSCSGARLVEPAREQAQLGPAWRDADCLAVYHGPKPLSVVPPHRGPNNINSGLIRVRPKLEACYAAGLLVDPKLAGKVIANFALDADGNITAATVTSANLKSPEVQQCMADAIRTGSFSGADGPVVVRYAFDFKTRRH